MLHYQVNEVDDYFAVPGLPPFAEIMLGMCSLIYCFRKIYSFFLLINYDDYYVN
jgi:hypothetical protein